MDEKTLTIAVVGKVPVLKSGPPGIVCDNSDYRLVLEMDEDWAAAEALTVIYNTSGGETIYHPITGREDTLPILTTPGILRIGVTAGAVWTTRDVEIRVLRSIRSYPGAEAPEPEPDVYDRIMEMLNRLMEGGVRSDWSVSNPADPAYVLNRTHWAEGEARVILPETYPTLLDEDNNGEIDSGSIVIPEELITGETYTVWWNGTPYECVAQVQNGIQYLTDGAVFRIFNLGSFAYVFATDGNLDVPVAITCGGETVHQLDPKYIRDMYWAEDKVLLDNAAYEFEKDSDDAGRVLLEKPLGLVAGRTYVVTHNGTKYTAAAQLLEDEDVKLVCLGNVQMNEGGLPFAVIDVPADLTEEVNAGAIIMADVVEGTFNLTLVMDIRETGEIHTIPPKYIADMYHTEVDNRVYLPEYTFAVDKNHMEAGEGINLLYKDKIVAGKKYRVLWNGTEYICTAKIGQVFFTALTTVYLGSEGIGMITPRPEVVGKEPFCIWVSTSTIDGYDSAVAYIGTSDQYGDTITMSVSGIGETVHQIPDKYLPEVKLSEEQIQAAVDKYLDENPVDAGVAFEPGNALEMTEDGVLNVKTTSEAEEDNTLPITSAGVHTIVGNIGAILDTI